MSTPYLLVCVEKPKSPEDRKTLEWPHWYALLEEYEKLGLKDAGVQRPIENVWLFPLNSCMRAATRFLGTSALKNFDYKLFLLDGEPVACQ